MTSNDAGEARALLAETVGRVLADALARGAAQTERAGFDAELWAQIEELGIPALLVPEADGGASGSTEDALAVAREVGRFAARIPLAETLLAQQLLAGAGLERPAGALTLAVDPAPAGALDPARGVFRGVLANVPWGAECAGVVVVAEPAGVPHVALLSPVHAAHCERSLNLAEEPRATLRFEDARAACAAAPPAVVAHLRERAALLRTGQLAGALAATVERSIAYAQSRVQFGKPIGQFQAVQQLLARMGSEAAAVDCAAAAAARAVDSDGGSFESACAKLRANIAADLCAAGAHQVHGAIGFTREQDLRLFTQRLLAWRGELGNDRHWSERLGTLVARRGADAFWRDLTARSDAQSQRR